MKRLFAAVLALALAVPVAAQSRYRAGDPESTTESAITAFLNTGLDARAREDAAVYIAERMAFGQEALDEALKVRAYEAAAAFLKEDAHRFRGLDRWEMRFAAVAIVDRSGVSGAEAVRALALAADPSREMTPGVRIRAVQALSRRAAADAQALDALKAAALKSSEPGADVRRWAVNGIAEAARANPKIAGNAEVLRFMVSVLENDAEAARWAGAALSSFDLSQASKETLAMLAAKLDGKPSPLSNDALVQRSIIDAVIHHPASDRTLVEALRAKLNPAQGDGLLRTAAAEALGRIGALGDAAFDEATVTALSNAMLRDSDHSVRGRAATALGCYGAAGRCADFALKRAFETEGVWEVQKRIETSRRRLQGEPEEAPVVIPDSSWRPARPPVRFDAPTGRETIRR